VLASRFVTTSGALAHLQPALERAVDVLPDQKDCSPQRRFLLVALISLEGGGCRVI